MHLLTSHTLSLMLDLSYLEIGYILLRQLINTQYYKKYEWDHLYFEIRASKTLTASQSFNENPCEVISFKDVSNSFPVQVSPDYIVIMPGFAFLILNVAKSLTSDGLVLVAGGREGWRPKFNCDWLASEWCSQCILVSEGRI